MRSPNGKLYVVPNGDITFLRNFSRAPFSSTKIRFSVRSSQLVETLDLLNTWGRKRLGFCLT